MHFYGIQSFHLTMSSSYLNKEDWTKQFISNCYNSHTPSVSTEIFISTTDDMGISMLGMLQKSCRK